MFVNNILSLYTKISSSIPSMDHIKLISVEKEMATHSIILAWRIPWAEEPGRLQSEGS